MKIIDLDSKNKICGVYKILCTANNEFYIGSSKDIIVRIKRHLTLLKANRYNNPYKCVGKNVYMQNAFNKYGADTFKFTIVEEAREEALLHREQYYIDTLNPKFNTSTKTNRPPTHSELSDEQKKQKYENFINTKIKNNTLQPTKETIEKVQSKRRGIFKHTKESMQKMIQTKIKNDTLCIPQPWRRGVKNPTHSKRMKKIFLTKKAAMTKEEIENHPFYGKKTQPTNLKPKLKLKNSITGEINELYGIDWNRQYGITMPAISRLRYDRQNFVIDKNNQKWNKVIEENIEKTSIVE